MGKLYSGWKKSAVWNPSNGDVVQFNLLSTEYSDFPVSNIKKETPTGNAFGGKTLPLSVGFLESDGLTVLEDWMENNTLVNSAVYAPAGQNIIFNETEEIQVVPGYGFDARAGIDVHRFDMVTIGEAPNVVRKQNIAPAFTWTTNDKHGELVLPISGIEFTVAGDFAGTTGNFTIECFDFDDNSLLLADVPIMSATRIQFSFTAPDDVWKIVLDFASAEPYAVTDISVRTDGKSEYIDY